MQQVISLNGEIQVATAEQPRMEQQFVQIETKFSAISPGTELMMQGNNRDRPLPLGYSAAGVITEVGSQVTDLGVGQQVACYGAPYVKHAQLLAVPTSLVVPIPEQVSLSAASTVGLGAIAIHAIRQANVTFGEVVVVIGLGIIGQLIAQIAHNAGMQVIAYDLVKQRTLLAKQCGISHVCTTEAEVEELLLKVGKADSVFIAGGKSGSIMDQSLRWLEDRGTVVVVADLDLDFSRELMFQKEANIVISRAAGPGRYDAVYERACVDYPIGYVRWTEGRNMAEYIRLLADSRLYIEPLITDTIDYQLASTAYERYIEQPEQTLGILLRY